MESCVAVAETVPVEHYL